MKSSISRIAGIGGGAAALSLAVAAMAPTGAQTGALTGAQTGAASGGVYSQAQAARGAEQFAANCARCHGAAMEGLDVAPPLTGARFLGNWTNQSVADLATRIRTTMPLDNPGMLGLTASAEITAAILAANGYPAGPTDLPASVSQLQPLRIDASPGGK